MRKYNKWNEVYEFTKYRMEIFTGRCKGVYMYNEIREERNWLVKMSEFIEEGTEIFFLERVMDNSNVYNVTGYIRKD